MNLDSIVNGSLKYGNNGLSGLFVESVVEKPLVPLAQLLTPEPKEVEKVPSKTDLLLQELENVKALNSKYLNVVNQLNEELLEAKNKQGDSEILKLEVDAVKNELATKEEARKSEVAALQSQLSVKEEENKKLTEALNKTTSNLKQLARRFGFFV